jgi:hypothetical protein
LVRKNQKIICVVKLQQSIIWVRRKRGRAKSKENYKMLQWVCPRVRGGRDQKRVRGG